MSRKFLVPIDLNKLEIQNVSAQNLASNPSSPAAGQFYYNTVNGTFNFYNGSAFIVLGRLDQITAPTGTVSLNNQLLSNIANPVSAQDAVNLQYLQSSLAGISSRAEVVYATAAALPTNTYANGSAGVGATLTATGNGALSVDGAAVATGQRILVKNEATAANNGIYTVTATGGASATYVLTRATDFDQNTEIVSGALVSVEAPSGVTAGTTNNQKIFISLTPSSVTVGTSSITWGLVGSSYLADETTLHLSGNTFNLITPVAIASGGTNATTAAAARANLVVPSTYATSIGDGSSTSYTVTHNLGTLDCLVQIYTVSSGVEVAADVTRATTNTVTVAFAVAPTTNQYRVVCIG